MTKVKEGVLNEGTTNNGGKANVGDRSKTTNSNSGTNQR